MESQNFKNHTRWVPGFHFVMSTLCLIVLILSTINLFRGFSILSVMFFIISIVLFMSFWFMRSFSTKVQDRAIRAEENLRYFTMTGKLLNKDLKMSQIIALRFADDDEFVELTDKAVKENLSNTDIKKLVQNWRADHHRA